MEKLIQTEYKPQLIITAPDVEQGRGQKLRESPVKTLAAVHSIDVLEPENLSDSIFVNEFKKFNPDLAILIAYGKIIPTEVLNIPEYGFLNIHPSLLPKYRGPSPFVAPILNGDEKTGATIIKLDSELDHGSILAQSEIKIEDSDTHQSLMEKTAILGADLLIDALPEFLKSKTDLVKDADSNLQSRTSQSLNLIPQDHSKATYTEKVEKQDGFVDIDNPPDHQTLDRMIRAYFPWPTVWTKIEGKIIKFLPEGKIQPEGKRPLTIKEFKNGYPKLAEKIKVLES